MTERVLSLDISSKTGWAFVIIQDGSFILVDCGQMDPLSEPDEAYPGSYITWAYKCFGFINGLIEKYIPDILVIEETAGGSKNAFSQKILEYIHFLTAHYIKYSGMKSLYFQTETWRREVGCLMTKEEKAQNKKIKDIRKVTPDQKVIKNEDGKRIGKVSKKHVNVRKANEIFGKQLKEKLIMAQEDTADALLMAHAYYLRVRREDEQ